ncbi:hypothetical protein J6590_047555 [Homalodisca vitripennis]|nr:hypothetical protein J6590_047555 [Homalodisca vitripennis]
MPDRGLSLGRRLRRKRRLQLEQCSSSRFNCQPGLEHGQPIGSQDLNVASRKRDLPPLLSLVTPPPSFTASR